MLWRGVTLLQSLLAKFPRVGILDILEMSLNLMGLLLVVSFLCMRLIEIDIFERVKEVPIQLC